MDGRLIEHFVGVGAKRISATEAAKAGISHGHELSASGPVLEMLGRQRTEFPCTYLYFTESADEGGYLEDVSTVTLYDAREHVAHRGPEWRLYYPYGCEPMESMGPGDYCWVALRSSGEVVIAVAESASSTARQLDRLFGTELRMDESSAPSRARQFALFDLAEAGDENLDLADADLLLALGVAPTMETEDRLSEMIERFGGVYPLPGTKAFTEYVRGVCAIENAREDPDTALAVWMSTTNELYFAYERHVLQPILDEELANRTYVDIDAFFRLATRFKNARFSRVGASFEHHIAAILDAAGLRYVQPRRMRDGSKPDFLLPTLDAYADADMPDELLTFLAAKTTTKERWRQIVTEATRVSVRHLITLDRELNADVLDAMAENSVEPVLPARHIAEYPYALQSRMSTVGEFIDLARSRETAAVAQGVLPAK